MRRKLVLLPILGIFLAGCGDIQQPITVSEPVKAVDDPRLIASNDLFLLPPGKDTNKLRVGDSPEDVARSFPTPPSAFTFRELPAEFASADASKRRYSAFGYGSEGTSFGVIYFFSAPARADEVAETMTIEDGLPDEEVQATVAEYEHAFDRPADERIPSEMLSPPDKVRYWFWEDGDSKQRFMLCAVISKDKKKSGLYQLTAAVGDDIVMDALRMDVKDALQDRRPLEPNASLTPSPSPKPETKRPKTIRSTPSAPAASPSSSEGTSPTSAGADPQTSVSSPAETNAATAAKPPNDPGSGVVQPPPR